MLANIKSITETMTAEMGSVNDGSSSNFITHTVCERKWWMQSGRQAGNIYGGQAKGYFRQVGPDLASRPGQARFDCTAWAGWISVVHIATGLIW